MVLQQSPIRNGELSTSRNLQIANELGNTFRVKYREIPVKSAWNIMLTREILCLPVKLVRVGMTMQLYQTVFVCEQNCSGSQKHAHLCAVFAFRRIATIRSGWKGETLHLYIGQTSHFCKYQVKLRHSTNTKLNFDVGNAGYIYYYT